MKAMTLYKSLNMWVQDLTFQQYFEDFLGKKREREGMRERKETLDESVRALSLCPSIEFFTYFLSQEESKNQ